MSCNQIHFEDGRDQQRACLSRVAGLALATLTIGGTLLLAQGHDVKAENGRTATAKLALTEAVPAQPRKPIRVIPLFDIPPDQYAVRAR